MSLSVNRKVEPEGAKPSGEEVVSDADSRLERLILEGNALEDAGHLERAIERYREGVSLAPAHPRARINLGNALAKAGRAADAEAAYRTAIGLAPRLATVRFNLASLLASTGKGEAAEDLLREALLLDPALAEAEVCLSAILASKGDMRGAEMCLQRALVIRPDYAGAAFNLAQILLQQGRFEEAVDAIGTATAMAAEADSTMLFALNNRPDLSPSRVARLHMGIGHTIEKRAGPVFTSWLNSRHADRKLRIGYVSGDFYAHPVGMLMKPILEQHCGDSVEVHCYSTSRVEDEITASLKRATPHWHEASRATADELCEIVRQHHIDILVDLSGHTSRNRLRSFARHPAPVQMTWLGYLNTSGLAAMDYRICDQYTDPVGQTEDLYAETLLRLPDSQWCYEPWLVPEGIRRVPQGSRSLCFGSLNNPIKISDDCLDVWTRILRSQEDSEVRFLAVPPDQHDSLLGRLTERGVDQRRISIKPRLSLSDYYRSIAGIDIALDTFPYNGGTTTLDTLWMGTPLIALKGDRPMARSSYSIVQSLRLTELVAESVEDYVAANLRLAQDTAWRSRLHAELRDRMRGSPLTDARSFVRSLESLYRHAWRTWCSRQESSTRP